MEFLQSQTPNTNCCCLQVNCPHVTTGVKLEPKRLFQFMVIHSPISKACLQKMKKKKEKKKEDSQKIRCSRSEPPPTLSLQHIYS